MREARLRDLPSGKEFTTALTGRAGVILERHPPEVVVSLRMPGREDVVETCLHEAVVVLVEA